MNVFKNKNALTQYINQQKNKGKTIGFAPTMGALHDGHLSLYHNARQENDIVISSIFVNPTQFNNPEDLEKYPRTIEQDIELLEKSQLVDTVYIPSITDLYPNGLSSKKYDFDGLENEMEGKFRPGHFDGVGTVVEELINQIQPDRAYFGEKDFQQLAIIKKMIEKNKIAVQIIAVPTSREKNGLALSSRNKRLSKEKKNEAAIIYETLKKVNNWFRITNIPEIKTRVEDIFNNAEGFDLEYFIIADEKTLKETNFSHKDKNYRAFIAVYTEGVRLIDNIHLD